MEVIKAGAKYQIKSRVGTILCNYAQTAPLEFESASEADRYIGHHLEADEAEEEAEELLDDDEYAF